MSVWKRLLSAAGIAVVLMSTCGYAGFATCTGSDPVTPVRTAVIVGTVHKPVARAVSARGKS